MDSFSKSESRAVHKSAAPADSTARKRALTVPPVQVDLESRLEALLRSVRRMDSNADVDKVRRCFEFAAKFHAGQRRKSGEPYIVHPLAVALSISEMRLDVPSVCAGLLHDTIEDTGASAEDINELAGLEVQMLVEGVTKLGRIAWHSREERQAENFRRMLLAMARDIRVVLVKLCDRLDNMRTMAAMPPDKQERISLETRDIYAPMAGRLGLQWLKAELDDLCFRYLEPQEFLALEKRLTDTKESRDAYIADVCKHLRAALVQASVPATVRGITKNLWSIFRKVRRAGREVDQLYDIMTFRIVTDSVRSCYAALGVVHTNWTPIPGRFKDFVALPKPNLYQSLHTTVVGPRTDRIEVQIRTTDQDLTAEQGVVATWRRGEDIPTADNTGEGKAFAWLEQLLEFQRDVKDPTEFIETVKTDLFEEEVFVFTPEGDVKALAKGSTPVDFAFAVHSKVGQHCSGARVNGLIVPLRYALRNGDTVDILTSEKQKPSKEWLKFVVTSRAKTRIRHHLRVEQRDRSRQKGRDLLAKALRALDKTLPQGEKDGRLDAAVRALRLPSVDETFVLLGYDKLNAQTVARQMYPDPTAVIEQSEAADSATLQGAPDPEEAPLAAALARRNMRRSVGGVRVQGEDDVVVRFAKCCGPIPGDSITAFMSRGRGVMVHVRDCPRALDQDPARRVDVGWDETVELHRPVTLEIICADKPGILAGLTGIFTDMGMNIAQAKCKAIDNQRAANTFQVNVRSVDELRLLVRRLFAVEGVVSVNRVLSAATAKGG